jgi:thioredoxin 1
MFMENNILEITEENFEKEVLNASVPVVIDFTAEWCTFCKVLGPIFEKVAEEYDGKVRFGVVNVDEQKKFAIANKVVGIPALLFYKDGTLVERTTGALKEEQLKGKLDAILK